MKNNLIKISVLIPALCLLASCAAFKNRLPVTKRPFQERTFDAKLWRDGDAQARGEMSADLHWSGASTGSYLTGKTRQEVQEILGAPDRKTRGRCCGAGGTFDEEVWLYDVEIPSGDQTVKSAHFQIYFTESGQVDELRIAPWDSRNPDYFPRVG